jgi:heme/copper-type cytochrome/quinol oxidase subunit 4
MPFVISALSILAVRAVIVQLAFFLHIQASLPIFDNMIVQLSLRPWFHI